MLDAVQKAQLTLLLVYASHFAIFLQSQPIYKESVISNAFFMKHFLQKFTHEPEKVFAHCDGPCGVYDPAQARVTAEAVLSMTKKLLDLKMPESGDEQKYRAYLHTFTRYAAVKEEQAQQTKEHLLVLWTDYFKPEHLEKYPDLHDIFWKAAKACSACKQEISLEHANELLVAVKRIHIIFWETKGREVSWVLAVQ